MTKALRPFGKAPSANDVSGAEDSVDPGRKMSPAECARQIVAGIENDRAEISVGLTKVLQAVNSVSPALARRIMIKF